jgi:hypothetical protein
MFVVLVPQEVPVCRSTIAKIKGANVIGIAGG